MVAYLGYRARALTLDGAVAACLVGGTVFGFGGATWAVLLVLFFASSSALSFVKQDSAQKRRAAETFEKGGRRDAAQVLANGGVAAAIALLSQFIGGGLPVCAFVGSLAAATADTWATELGVLSQSPPRLITNMKTVPAGTSGEVTLMGSAASLAGALFIGLAAAVLGLFSGTQAAFPALVLAGLVGGACGSLVDSLVGAILQASYICDRCDKPTESRVHFVRNPRQARARHTLCK